MYTYIKHNIKGKYVEFPEQLDPSLYDNLGTSYQDYLEGKWVLLSDKQISFKKNNPSATVKEVCEMQLSIPIKIERTISKAKEEMQNKILTHDSSSVVNSFYIQGIEMWLDKATRAGLKLRFEAEIAMGQEKTVLWYNNTQFPLNVNDAIQMLYAIEIYASACYDNTQYHLSEVNKLETIEEIDAYDYTSGYPEKLQF